MIVVDKEKVVNGSNAMSTVVEPQRQRSKTEAPRKRTSTKTTRKTELKSKLKVMSTVSICFMVGVLLIGRYTTIYKNQNAIRNLKSEIESLKYNNDDLKVHLLKFEDINAVDKEAREKFTMITPGVNNVIYSDLSKNNFGEKTESKSSKTKEVFEKIKNILF